MAKMVDGYIFLLHPDKKGTEIRVEQKELVLCKNCKHFETGVFFVGGYYEGCTEWMDAGNAPPTEGNGFCYRGERKDE